jgi:hypothetical protein
MSKKRNPPLPSTVVPAYGRDYKTAKEAKEAWLAGKDWKVADYFSPWDGKPISIRDFPTGTAVTLRFNRMTKTARVTTPAKTNPGCSTKRNPRRFDEDMVLYHKKIAKWHVQLDLYDSGGGVISVGEKYGDIWRSYKTRQGALNAYKRITSVRSLLAWVKLAYKASKRR